MTSAYRSDDRSGPAEVEARVMLAAAEVLTAERERVLRGTHLDVLDELLAASLSIAALTHDVEPALRIQLDDVLEALERAVALLRTTMYEQTPLAFDRVRPTALLGESVAASARMLGFTPEAHIDDEVDEIDDARLLGHVVLSIRELTSNVARHAAAASARITVRVADGSVELEVTDDGIGIAPDHVAGRGFTSLSERAGQLGGLFEVVAPSSDRDERGTVIRWRVPVRRERP